MGFNADKFDRAEMKPRTMRVPVPALAEWFGEGEAAEWEIRGLNATELHHALQAEERNSLIGGIVKAISASGDVAQAVRKAVGLTQDTPGEIAKRLEMLVMGSVNPKVEMPTAVKLAERFPIEFLHITSDISLLTGKGYDLVKPPAASQETTA